MAEKEKATRSKTVYKGNRKKERFRELRKMGMTKKIGTILKETMDFMSVAIFDLTSNERMNGLPCWMKHVG